MSRPYTAHTLIAEAVAEDPGLVQRLAAFHPTLDRLGDPVLRAKVGRLVTFEDVARIAGVETDSLLAVANHEAAPVTPQQATPQGGGSAAPLPPHDAYVDARVLLERGEAPLGEVLRNAQQVPPGGTLIVDAPFDPAPLRRLLRERGFSDHGVQLAPDHWRLTFRRAGDEAEAQPAQPEQPAEDGGRDPGSRVWQAADGVHIDVRGQEPPQPMLDILQLIESSRAGNVVVVHHEREPVYLYPELVQRGWSYAIIAGNPDEVRLLLRRMS